MKMSFGTSGSNIRYKYFSAAFLILPLLFAVCTKTVSTHPATVVLQGKPAVVNEKGVLRGEVAVERELPQEFYGTWTVISVLMETNNPDMFRKKSADLWTFSRNEDVITLSNPTNGATASITVNEVNGKTAKFTRFKKEENVIEIETPEITVDGDNFYGTDTIVIQHFRNEKKTKTDIVKYKVIGEKISGQTLKDIFAK